MQNVKKLPTDCTKCANLVLTPDITLPAPIPFCNGWKLDLTYGNGFKIISRCLHNPECNKFKPKSFRIAKLIKDLNIDIKPTDEFTANIVNEKPDFNIFAVDKKKLLGR